MQLPTKDILAFWFGAWPFDAALAEKQKDVWFTSNSELDDKISNMFKPCVEYALNHDIQLETLEDKIAYILLLDQFTRNIFRGDGKAFSGDSKALDVCLEIVHSKAYQSLPEKVAVFACMPLQHSEEHEIQQISIATFSDLVQIHGESAESFLKFAHMHKEIIDQFSRYPHRNEALNRTSTPQELDYLKGGQRFGQ